MDPSLLLLLFVAALALPLFLGSRRQRRAMRESQEMQGSLAVGDRVMTTSGMHATVVGLAEDTLELEIAPGVVTTWVRQAIREKLTTTDEDSAEDEDDPEVTSAVEESARSERS